MNIEISIIIINYNCETYIYKCIESIYKQTKDISFEIIVVDNDSTDNSLVIIREAFPEIRIIENRKNIGFGAANNVGARQAKGSYLLLLNPDTLLLNNALRLFYDHAKSIKENLGCSGGNLLDDKLKPANLGGNFPSLFQLFSDIGFRHFYPHYYKRQVSLMLTEETLPKQMSIDCICGADLFISKAVFNQMNGFDEDYFLYYEDTDLCYRLKKEGYDNYIVPEVRIIHLESAAIIDDRSEKLNMRKFSFFEKGKQLFFRKSYGYRAVIAAKFLTIFYILSRCVYHRGNITKYLKMVSISLKMSSK